MSTGRCSSPVDWLSSKRIILSTSETLLSLNLEVVSIPIHKRLAVLSHSTVSHACSFKLIELFSDPGLRHGNFGLQTGKSAHHAVHRFARYELYKIYNRSNIKISFSVNEV